MQTIDEISASIQEGIKKIKASNTIDRAAITKSLDDIQKSLDKTLEVIKKEQEKQKLAEEVGSVD